MPIQRDLSGLAAHGEEADGLPPDPQIDRIAEILGSWFDSLDHTPRAQAADTPFRHSDAGFCARSLAYKVSGADETNPPGVADRWRMLTGVIIHDRIQEHLKSKTDDSVLIAHEVPVVLHVGDKPVSSGHIDTVIEFGDTRTIEEYKTVGGYGFKMAIGARGPAEGPRTSAIYQTALNAEAVDADAASITIFSVENLSPRELAKLVPNPGPDDEYRRFAARWTFSREQLRPYAMAELGRFQAILEHIADEKPVPRHTPSLPQGARINNPAKGSWIKTDADGNIVDAGSTWECDYCRFRDLCVSDMQAES